MPYMVRYISRYGMFRETTRERIIADLRMWMPPKEVDNAILRIEQGQTVRTRAAVYYFTEKVRPTEEQFQKQLQQLQVKYGSVPRDSPRGAERDVSEYQQRLLEIRKSYPRAYEKWTSKEEKRLGLSFKAGKKTSEIADELQRQPSAILSRLKRLGLIET